MIRRYSRGLFQQHRSWTEEIGVSIARPKRPSGNKSCARSLPGSDKSGCEQSQQGNHLFDHLVGNGEEARRDRKAKRLGSFHVDDKFEFGWLEHR
jgi:hypothetical protein